MNEYEPDPLPAPHQIISGESCKIHAAHYMFNDVGALVCVGCLVWRDEREWPDKVKALELQVEELQKKLAYEKDFNVRQIECGARMMKALESIIAMGKEGLDGSPSTREHDIAMDALTHTSEKRVNPVPKIDAALKCESCGEAINGAPYCYGCYIET